ncbi:MAG: hypothetical protein ACREIN_02010 [Candidatus Methylomirabilaceae bacterium]
MDLTITIERSNYYANIIKRAAAGDTSRKVIIDLQRYLERNPHGVWENSWVRFPSRVLSRYARHTLDFDLLADKRHLRGGPRSDVARFFFHQRGEEWVRVPISYLIKLALADLVGSQPDLPVFVRRAGERLMRQFSNDNTSPETRSSYVIPLRPATRMGSSVARETCKRFLITHLLTMYANTKFLLAANGQQAMVYFAPHPPIRQKDLNNCISDAFYRDLFMSPCLSGWDDGEAKQQYMHLCHQVLSRSQLNAVAKLREAGIIHRNLVVLPNLSTISLANNGTHVSLGSLRMLRGLADETSGFTAAHEKLVGDLAIKIVEHFLPLFVGTYSAAPYRLDFSDFHPETALGFLPHELDYTHLRMIWRRWRGKANLSVLGHPITPFGPTWLDRLLSGLFRLRGDFIPDFRLIDYLVALMSTDQSPALDGRLGNAARLKKDLADLGVFDERISLYLPYRLREFAVMGFSGFEGRHYSLFELFDHDMGRAVDLQNLVTALAFKYMAQGRLDHIHIPDDPSLESERRQIFFGTALGIPTFFVRRETRNLLLKRIVERTRGVRASRRYPEYLRVPNLEYRRTLIQILREDAADLIDALGVGGTVDDLVTRLEHPEECSAAGRLVRKIVDEAGADSAMDLDARDFNQAAERYYREQLRRRHLDEAFRILRQDFKALEAGWGGGENGVEPLRMIREGQRPLEFLSTVEDDVVAERVSVENLRRLMNLVLISLHRDIRRAEADLGETGWRDDQPTSIRGTAYAHGPH